MEADIELPRDEVGRLQRCMNELAGILALPAAWVGDDPSHIAHTLLDTLLTTLDVDVVYLRLTAPERMTPVEMAPPRAVVRTVASRARSAWRSAGRWDNDATTWPASAQISVGDASLSVAPARLGLRGDIGVLVAGAQRPGFPSQTDSVLLRVAANQAALAFVQQACRAPRSASSRDPRCRKPIRT